MNSNKKIVGSIIVIIVIVIAGYFVVTSLSKPANTVTSGTENNSSGTVSNNGTASNASVASTVKALNSSADQENTIVTSDEGESGITSMTQAVNDTANAYDPSKF